MPQEPKESRSILEEKETTDIIEITEITEISDPKDITTDRTESTKDKDQDSKTDSKIVILSTKLKDKISMAAHCS